MYRFLVKWISSVRKASWLPNGIVKSVHCISFLPDRVVAINDSVQGFMLDPSIGEFVLTDPNMKIPKRGKVIVLKKLNLYYEQWTRVSTMT